MPSEDRRIIFTAEEVYRALFALCTKKQVERPPPGHIVDVHEREEEGQPLVISLQNPQVQNIEKLEYSRDFMAAALLLLCKGTGIPVPKNGRKSVLVKDGQVVLRVLVG